MLKSILISCFVLVLISAHGQKTNKHSDFKVTYSYAGLGSNLGSFQPVFKVKGNTYNYTLEQNSSLGERSTEYETIGNGNLRISSIDSIIDIVESIEDTLIYAVNPGVMSGGIHYIEISNETINLSFCLHNASHPLAEKIVAILNSNLPADQRKLWLFEI